MPSRLARYWSKWRALARAVGKVQTNVVLSVCYFVFVGPVAILVILLMDPLRLRSNGAQPTYWRDRESPQISLDEAQRQ